MGSCISKKQNLKYSLTKSRSIELKIREKKNEVLMNKVKNCPKLQLHTNLKYLQRILHKSADKTMFSYSEC